MVSLYKFCFLIWVHNLISSFIIVYTLVLLFVGSITQDYEQAVPVFNNLVMNETDKDVEAEFLGSQYILPRQSSFYMVCQLIAPEFCIIFNC